MKISLKKDEAQTNELFLFMGLSGFFYHTCVCICTVDSLSHNLGSTRGLFDVVASEQCHCKCDNNLLNIIDTDVCNIEAIKNYTSIS